MSKVKLAVLLLVLISTSLISFISLAVFKRILANKSGKTEQQLQKQSRTMIMIDIVCLIVLTIVTIYVFTNF